MEWNPASKAAKLAAYGMAAVFAAVGIIFLVAPGGVIAFFNTLSVPLGLRPAPVSGVSLYSALAAAYMYVVTFLAWNMARRPDADIFPRLLVHAKLASAIVSLGLFAVGRPYLILLANGIIDGGIGVAVEVWFRRGRGAGPAGGPGRRA